MPPRAEFLAVDLGASNGRVLAGQWDGARFSLAELHRFPNGPIAVAGSLHWNVLGLWSEILTGLRRFRERSSSAPAGIGVDAWGVDFALLDPRGKLLSPPCHYRDHRTDGLPAQLFSVAGLERECFRRTGVQTMQINTLFQLMSMREDAVLGAAGSLLMMPDLFHYFLSGAKTVEYTEATTTQMLAENRSWDSFVLAAAGIPAAILPAVSAPGTVLGQVLPLVLHESGIVAPFPVVSGATHDTASAVAAIPGMDAGSVFLSSGTWSLMGVEADAPATSEQAMRLGFTSEGDARGRYLVLKNLTGLWILQECVRNWARSGQHYEWSELMQMAAHAPTPSVHFDTGAADLLAPEDMPGAVAAICGLPRMGAAETARCCLESLALKYRQTLADLEILVADEGEKRAFKTFKNDTFAPQNRSIAHAGPGGGRLSSDPDVAPDVVAPKSAGARPRRFSVIRMAGGGAQNTLLCQLTADACGVPVVAGSVEASALGNVVMQAVALGYLGSLDEGRAAIAASVECVRYEPRNRDYWDEAYGRFRSRTPR